MEHGARQNTTRVIAVGFISLGTLLTLSLATNIIQGINNYRLQTEQKVAVTPMLFRAPFAVSQNQADASYIEQLGLSFVALRLNVTPETVDAVVHKVCEDLPISAEAELVISGCINVCGLFHCGFFCRCFFLFLCKCRYTRG